MDPGQLTTAFAVWAAVVGMIGMAIVWELARLRTELTTMSTNLNEYIVSMERRVVAIETHMQIHHGFQPANHFGAGGQ